MLKHFAVSKRNATFASEFGTKRCSGALVQLVRIHACHAWGHGFESRTHRRLNVISFFGFLMKPPFNDLLVR